MRVRQIWSTASTRCERDGPGGMGPATQFPEKNQRQWKRGPNRPRRDGQIGPLPGFLPCLRSMRRGCCRATGRQPKYARRRFPASLNARGPTGESMRFPAAHPNRAGPPVVPEARRSLPSDGSRLREALDVARLDEGVEARRRCRGLRRCQRLLREVL